MEKVTLRRYINRLNQLAKDNPELLDTPVVASSDDEGNSFGYVYYDASEGHFDGEDWQNNDDDLEVPINSVCLN